MTTKTALEYRGNGIGVNSTEPLVIPMHGRALQAHSQTASTMKCTIDYNRDELCLITEHFAKFVPKTVKHLVGTNPEDPELSKRETDVSVLFLDICDYARLSETLSLQVLNRLVEQYFSTFLDQIHEAGGDINEIAGDGFMAIFHDPTPQKHAVKAADACLALMAATEALNEENQQPPLGIHMGLNSGLALVGITRLQGRYETRWTFTASGPVTNLAARLAGLAKPGQILVGPETVQRLGGSYDFRKLTRKYLKNLMHPIDIYSLVGSRHSPSSDEPTRRWC